MLAFADGRAQLPGESVSRLRLHQLGFAQPRLQVRVDHPDGYWRLDFGLDDVDRWGEFDGEGKYTNREMLGAGTPGKALMQEKYREDMIRGITNRGIVRWGSAHIVTPDALRKRFVIFAVTSPGGPGRVPPTFRGPVL